MRCHCLVSLALKVLEVLNCVITIREELPKRYINACDANTHYYDETNIKTKTDTNICDMTQYFLDTPNKCNDMQTVQELAYYIPKKYADVFQGISCFKDIAHIDREDASHTKHHLGKYHYRSSPRKPLTKW